MSIPGKLARTILSNKMTTANAALSLGFGIDSYQTAREEGSGVIGDESIKVSRTASGQER